jgi:hypothetical protein
MTFSPSERFLAPLTKNGLPEDRERLNDISTVFTVGITHSVPLNVISVYFILLLCLNIIYLVSQIMQNVM